MLVTGFTLTDKFNTRLSAHAVYVCIIKTVYTQICRHNLKNSKQPVFRISTISNIPTTNVFRVIKKHNAH